MKSKRAPLGVALFFVATAALLAFPIGWLITHSLGTGWWPLNAALGVLGGITSTRMADRWWRKRTAALDEQPPQDGAHDRIEI